LVAVNLGEGGPAGSVVAERELNHPTIELTGVEG